jgi:uncharacterized membrane protein YkoI
MTKKLILGGALGGLILAAAAAGAVSAQSTEQTQLIGTQKAIEIALAEVPGEVAETELERDDSPPVYEIEIVTAEGVEMEIEIDAKTGEVLEVEQDD